MDDHKVDIYMPLYVRDFLTSTFGWSAEERGHYLTLLMVQWDRGTLPAGLEDLERLSPGVGTCWAALECKFPVCDDGARRNQRLEQHKGRSLELKAARVAAGKAGGKATQALLKQRSSNASGGAQATLQANGQAKIKPPTSTSTSSLREENSHTTRTRGDDNEFRKPGWAGEEWASFVAVWNATPKAAKWTPLVAPDGWVDAAASPGWLQKARLAVERLPRCLYFDKPLAVTQFILERFVDRILAGEFDNAKSRPKERGGDFGGTQPPPKAFTGKDAAAFEATRRAMEARRKEATA
jgi:uncharacterized protein YdaU (DUF1376 family)